jgi:hypothetical protein
MNQERANSIVFVFLVIILLAAPLPLGGNRYWSWNLLAMLSGIILLSWVLVNYNGQLVAVDRLGRFALAVFLVPIGWVLVQLYTGVPDDWKHPVWSMASETLGQALPGSISLGPGDGWGALVRLLAYGCVFVIALQLGQKRDRARKLFGWLTIAGFLYAAFGLWIYWSGGHPEWLFGNRVLAHDVRSTFINRNHFATWQGLTILAAVAWLYQLITQPSVRPYDLPGDRETEIVNFLLSAWKPLTGLLLMVTSLILTHSRGGFVASLLGMLVLMLLLDRRSSKRGALSRVSVVAAFLVASIAFFLTSEVLLDRINRTDITTEQRLAVFGDIGRGIDDNAILGYGYGTFQDSFQLYDRLEEPFLYDRAHNTWLENAFELGIPAAIALYVTIVCLAVVCLRAAGRRRRDWVYPATGVAASVLVAVHALVDFSIQLPAVAMLYAAIMGVAVAQTRSSDRAVLSTGQSRNEAFAR